MRPLLALVLALAAPAVAAPPPAPAERVHTWVAHGARLSLILPPDFDDRRPTLIVLFALPNGNTIEQSLGARAAPGLDWHFDIQHVLAQVRRLRQLTPGRNVALACAEAERLSWPAWRAARPDDNGRLIRALVDQILAAVPGDAANKRLALTAHSGGGSFLFGFVNAADAIPATVERIAFIDANYAFDNDKLRHADKLLAWLRGGGGGGGGGDRHLVVLAYDDRNVQLNGRNIVSPTGGTYYRSRRMIEAMGRTEKLAETRRGPFESVTGMDGRLRFLLHTNPETKILHTVLVERNGLLHALTTHTPDEEKWGQFWGDRAYADLIPPEPLRLTPGRDVFAAPTTAPSTIRPSGLITQDSGLPFPPRPADAPTGSAFCERVAGLPPKEREAAILREVTRGNVPAALRTTRPVRATLAGRALVYHVLPDYLAVGSDADSVRLPMTPMTAGAIAAAVGATLPTPRMVDDVYAAADVRLDPRPLTKEREAVPTFVQHDALIRDPLAAALARPSPTTRPAAPLIAGHKKDVVQTPRLKDRPGKVAIYGWHKADGRPIQPLYLGHADTYVDYSHGVRLVAQRCTLDGKETTIDAVLADPTLGPLLTGP